ncbi:uncharacterized protein [Tiliqua scincoides]|uniref:uncharacterized protein n=1 Tax=Tiliqua scincoides TaxID=71010 RepID=UPI0034619534
MGRRRALPGYPEFYRARWAQGGCGPCQDPALKSRARAGEGGPGRWDVRGIAEASAGARGERPGGALFAGLARAFGFLELLCVNLFACPWRSEIRALKTFTGNFVYYVRSVLPDGIVERLLEEIGYIATTATEFSLVRKLSESEAEQAAFDLFLARIECEDIFEMAKDARDSDLGDILQKRAQKHWPPEGALVQKHQLSQRQEYGMTGSTSKTQGCCSPQQATPAEVRLAFDDAANGGLKFTTDESQPLDPEFSSEPNTNQSHGSASENSCVKSTDSEDFLMKYSDIVIGQKPLHLANLSPKEMKTQATGLISTMLGASADGKRPPTVPSPDASGPQALAILNDVTLESGVCYGCRSQGSSQEAIELKIRDAMKCLSVHESDSTDKPKELKGNAIQHSNKIISACHISREEETRDLSSTSAKLKIMEDSMEGLIYPVEETAQPELNRSRIDIQEFSHSRMELTDPPGPSKGSLNVDLYSSSQFCNTTRYKYPSVHSDQAQLLTGIPDAHRTSEGFRDISRPSGSSLVIPPGVKCGGGPLAENQHRGNPEKCPLHSSFTGEDASFDTCIVKMNDADTEGYVVISKDQ